MFCRLFGLYFGFQLNDCFLKFSTKVGRKQVMTQAKIQPFFKSANIDCIGYFSGKGILPGCVQQKNNCF